MPSLLVIVLVVETILYIVNTIGHQAFNNLIWYFIGCLPFGISKLEKERRMSQLECLRIKRDMQGVSAQDQFAKWARYKRDFDKVEKIVNDKTAEIEKVRAAFEKTISAIRIVCLKAPQYILPFWYSKTPMFWLPKGLYPYYAEWFLSFPRAPMGSVSIATWQVACVAVISLIGDVIAAVLASRQKEAPPVSTEPGQSEKPQKMLEQAAVSEKQK